MPHFFSSINHPLNEVGPYLSLHRLDLLVLTNDSSPSKRCNISCDYQVFCCTAGGAHISNQQLYSHLKA